MSDLLESLTERLTTEFHQTQKKLSRSYQCRCGTAIFFRNTQCLSCNSPLGYLPGTHSLVALQPDFYPFVMSKPVVAKLQLVQMIVVDRRDKTTTEGRANTEAAA